MLCCLYDTVWLICPILSYPSHTTDHLKEQDRKKTDRDDTASALGLCGGVRGFPFQIALPSEKEAVDICKVVCCLVTHCLFAMAPVACCLFRAYHEISVSISYCISVERCSWITTRFILRQGEGNKICYDNTTARAGAVGLDLRHGRGCAISGATEGPRAQTCVTFLPCFALPIQLHDAEVNARD